MPRESGGSSRISPSKETVCPCPGFEPGAGSKPTQTATMHNTKIQWSDGTVSPVPTCDGCPLRESDAVVAREIKNSLQAEGISEDRIAGAVQTYQTSPENSRRQRILAAIATAIP